MTGFYPVERGFEQLPSNSCKHPLKAFKIGINPETGKDLLKVTSYKVDHLERKDPHSKLEYIYDDIQAPNRIHYNDFVSIPCGQCIGCRLQYSREWANRCLLHMQDYDSSYFITLTYDPKHLPTHTVNEYVNEEGEIIENIEMHSLIKRDFQNFMKELRYFTGQKLSYFACGEYGDKGRPHYHAIIFGLKLDDLQLFKVERCGDLFYNLYLSETISKAWKHQGFVLVSEANWQNIAYTARYVTKKLKGEQSKIYDDLQLTPPFVLMSRKPGIGRKYFEDNNYVDLFMSDRIYVSTDRGSISFKPPRYYKRMLDQIDTEFYNDLKKQSKEQMDAVNRIKMQKTDLSYLEALEIEEDVLNESIKSLVRNKL